MAKINEFDELATTATTFTRTTNASTAETPANEDDDGGVGAGGIGGDDNIYGSGVQSVYAPHKQLVAAAGNKQHLLLLSRPQTPTATMMTPTAATPTTTTPLTNRVMSAISSDNNRAPTATTTYWQQQQHQYQHLNRSPTAMSAATALPLFEVKLELMSSEAQLAREEEADVVTHTNTEIRFVPSFNVSVENNFQQIVEQLLEDIHQTSHGCMPRRIVDDKALSDDNEKDDDDDDEDDGERVGVEAENNGKHECNTNNGDQVDIVECNNNDYVLQVKNSQCTRRNKVKHQQLAQQQQQQQKTTAFMTSFHEVAVAKRLQSQRLTTKTSRTAQQGGEDSGTSAKDKVERTSEFYTSLVLYVVYFTGEASFLVKMRLQVNCGAQ